jgi:hypothetical protein
MKVPYLSIPDVPLSAPSQTHIPVADVVDDLVLFKDGGASLVMESTSLNFGLLSEKEQQAVIAAYAALINSLSFSVQIVIRTQRKDITSYMKFLDEASKKITNQKLAFLMSSYKTFISDSIKKKNVLGKKFYIIIPFSPLELGVTKSILSTTRRKGPLPFPKSYVLKKAKVVLYPRRDHLVRQAGRLGLVLRQLTSPSLIELFYDVYNPEPPAVKVEQGGQAVK